MHGDAAGDRAPWDTPEATAITDTDSRADEADVTRQNAPTSIPA